jgi:hypothetical protein
MLAIIRKGQYAAIITFNILIIMLCATQAYASADYYSTPPPMTSLINVYPSQFGYYGFGNAILNPYNDSRVNLVLLMIKPAGDQRVHTENIYHWDVINNNIYTPFDVGSLIPADSLYDMEMNHDYQQYLQDMDLSKISADSFDVEMRRRYQQFLKLLQDAGLSEPQIKDALVDINPDITPPSLSKLAMRALDFQAVLHSDSGLTETDKKIINKRLLKLEIESVAQGAVKDYLDYITAADAFYNDDFNEAESRFRALTHAQRAWVKETATYNLIRVAIRKTQASAEDKYGFLDIETVNKALAGSIMPAIQDYLATYPNGKYVESAKNLKRRAYWLNGDDKTLLMAFQEAIEEIRKKNDFSSAVNLAVEIDNKYLFAHYYDDRNNLPPALTNIEWDKPVLAAAQILVRLRKLDKQNGKNSIVDLREIQAHETNFKAKNADTIYQYILLAYDFFEEKNYDAVIQASQNWHDGLNNGDYAAFSIASLRAFALEKLQRYDDAAALLKELHALSPSPLLKDHFELAQAQNLVASGKARDIFTADSVIQSANIKERVLRGSANAEVLQYVLDQPHTSKEEKSTGLATLLHKSLMTKQFKALLKYQKKYANFELENLYGLAYLRAETISSDDNFVCPSWSSVLTDLTGEDPSPRNQICLGERLRTLEDHIYLNIYSDEELGGTDDGFGKRDLTRLELYLPLIDNPAVKGEDEAYALRRAIYCFATTGSNHCGNEDIPIETRKYWFNKLKKEYKNSEWSIKQKYYW